MGRSFLAVAAALCLLSCDTDDKVRVDDNSADSLRVAVAVETREAAARHREQLDAEEDRRAAESIVGARRRCEAARSLPGSLDRIFDEPADYVAGDSCMSELLGAIVERFVRDGDDKYLDALDALSKHADSRATEVFGDALIDLFRARPVELVKHLYALQGDATATEIDALLVTEIQLGKGGARDDGIRSIIEDLERGKRLTTDEKRYLSRLESQLWTSRM